MRCLGCLVLIVLVVVGIYLLTSTQDMSDQQKAQWVGQKAHRGWNQARKFAADAREGWKTGEDKPATGQPQRP